MFIPCPFPSIQESLDYMSFPWITYLARGTGYVIRHREKANPWYLHYHFLADYGQEALLLLEKRMDTTAFLTRYLPTKKQLLHNQSTYIDTGPPEWWGSIDIHKSHRDFLKYNTDPWHKKHDNSFIIEPKRDIEALLTNLQPILRSR